MFNKGKDGSNGAGGDTPATPPKRGTGGPKMPGAPSILGADLEVVGSVTSEGEVQLDGNVEGDVRAGSLTIGEKAAVKGEVFADKVIVRGRVLGSVRGRQVQLAATARIEGDIIHSALSVEAGAFFEGHCRYANDPLNPAEGGAAITDATPARLSPPITAGDTTTDAKDD